MSLTVFAGTAQLASLPLLATQAPMWVVWASAFCVNLRFVIFSAQWRVHLGHLPRGRRLLLGYFLADLNLLVFQKAWPSGSASPVKRVRDRWCDASGGLAGRVIVGIALRRSCRRTGGSASPARSRCSASPTRCSTIAPPARRGCLGRRRDRRVRAAAEAQHPGRDRRGRRGERRDGRAPATRCGAARRGPHDVRIGRTALTILGMAAVTLVARGFFLFGEREAKSRGAAASLQVAPLAAIVAVVAPEIFMTHGR